MLVSDFTVKKRSSRKSVVEFDSEAADGDKETEGAAVETSNEHHKYFGSFS